MEKSKLPGYLFIVLLAIAVWMTFLIVKPFMIAIITSVLIAYITYPLYSRIKKLIKNKNISSLIMALLIVIIITLPLFFILNVITKEAYVGYILSKQKIVSGDIFPGACEDKTNIICSLSAPIEEFISNPRVRFYLEDTAQKVSSYIINSASSFLFSIPVMVLNFFIMIFIMFYLFRDGKAIFEKVENLIPLKGHHRKQVLKKINNVTYAVVYGQLLVAMVQGALGGLGFLIFGIPSPLLWGAVMALLALVPWVGTAIIWLPAALFQIITGYIQSDTGLITRGILLILYGALIVSTIDNILKPKLIGKKGGIHPILALIGVLGGLSVFGFIGIFIGPIILAIFMTLVQIYEDEENLLAIEKR
jgi:predicted PurR-regulated permease PerM|tara:strand:+ start:43 stop:1128 length:1086 start_codon:yes stop_codon:yes gene_type:complete